MENVPNEILRTPDWLVDHRGGRLRRLHARFGGALCGVPMRRDAYAGMCWLIDGAEVPLSAVRRSGRPVYTGRFSANGLALALSLSYAADKAGRLTVSAALQNEADTATPPFRASLRLGFDTFLAQYPDYNDQLFPTLLRCKKRTCGVIFLRPRADCWPCSPTRPRRPTRWIMKKTHRGSSRPRWISSSRDGCPPGIPRALTGFPPAKKRPGTSRFCPWGRFMALEPSNPPLPQRRFCRCCTPAAIRSPRTRRAA